MTNEDKGYLEGMLGGSFGPKRARVPSEGDQVRLEGLVDAIGLYETVQLLATIAGDKADHIRASYQDEHLASRWDRAAHEISAAFVPASL